jgi:3-deoxy-D-manno-octulosonic-acid transferase
MILLYQAISLLIYPLIILIILLRKYLGKEDPKRYKEKIYVNHFNVKRKHSKLIWFHAASVGELQSIMPIIKELNKKNKNLEFLITTVTLSSSHLANQEFKKLKNVYHRFFPVDVVLIIKRFIYSWKPNAIILVDSEIWPNLILKAEENKIPIGVINARITAKTFKRWMLFPSAAKRIFNILSFCFTSNKETKKYLLKLKAKKVKFLGNIKFANHSTSKKLKNINDKYLKSRRYWLAASTHNNEEELCLKTHLELKKKYRNIITVIAPRHTNRVEQIKDICSNFKLSFQILKKNQLISKNKEIILINFFGGLNNFYKYTKSVFIGKSTIKKLKNDSGQNPLDAARFGCKIYHGPYVYNFKGIYNFLEKKNFSKNISNYLDLSAYLVKDLKMFNEKNNKPSLIINKLGKKTLTNTIKELNSSLFHAIN